MFWKIYAFAKNFILDLFFPKLCFGCGAEGEWICSKCLGKMEVVKVAFCPNCKKPTIFGEVCETCRSKVFIDGVVVCAHFKEGVLREAIHNFKFNFVFDVGNFFGKMMVAKTKNYECRIQNTWLSRDNPGVVPAGFDLVVPVPLHKKRFAFRGFNQAEILSRVICRERSRPFPTGWAINCSGLKRIKHTTPQSELDREERLKNLKEVFVWSGEKLFGKKILLVDDITTTGSTLEECAKVLKSAGAESVWGIVLARG